MEAFAQVASTPLAGTAPPIDMSVYGLFMQADWIVKSVMLALLLASFWSWAIIFEKMLRLRSLKKSAQSFEDTFWSGVSLEDLYDRVGAKPTIRCRASSPPRCASGGARCPRAWPPAPRRAPRSASASSR